MIPPPAVPARHRVSPDSDVYITQSSQRRHIAHFPSASHFVSFSTLCLPGLRLPLRRLGPILSRRGTPMLHRNHRSPRNASRSSRHPLGLKIRLEELEPRFLLSTYVVDDPGTGSLGGSVPGETFEGTITLESAIEQVNLDGFGTIKFSGPMDIITLGLPAITADGVTIDGGGARHGGARGNKLRARRTGPRAATSRETMNRSQESQSRDARKWGLLLRATTTRSAITGPPLTMATASMSSATTILWQTTRAAPTAQAPNRWETRVSASRLTVTQTKSSTMSSRQTKVAA